MTYEPGELIPIRKLSCDGCGGQILRLEQYTDWEWRNEMNIFIEIHPGVIVAEREVK